MSRRSQSKSAEGAPPRRRHGFLASLRLVLNRQPVYWILYVTGRCNARCDHCFLWREIERADRSTELTLDELRCLAACIGPALVVNLAGGEPYLRNDLCEIANLFSRHSGCRLMTIPSNGLMTDRIVESAARLCDDNPNTFFRFSFSLDGIGPAHDAIRGVPGLFDRTCATVRRVAALRARYHNFAVLTSTVFGAHTQGHILELMDWIEENLPVDQVNVTFVRGHPKYATTLQPERPLYDRVIERLVRPPGHRATRTPVDAAVSRAMFLNTLGTVAEAADNEGRRVFRCYAGRKFLVVDHHGDVYPCEMLGRDSCLGSLRDFGFDAHALLASPKAREVIGRIRTGGCACTWECAIQASKAFDPLQWPGVLVRVAGLQRPAALRRGA